VAEQVNELGRIGAVIHNAGILGGRAVLPVNVVAPYLLTALISRPQRLVYLSSGMHTADEPSTRSSRGSCTGWLRVLARAGVDLDALASLQLERPDRVHGV
jgi:hypothetical protein